MRDILLIALMSELQFPTPYVVLKANDGTKRQVELAEGNSWTLGRDKDNSIVILDSSVSRHHAILQYMDSHSIYLIDLGSTNGSFVNQQRVSIPTLLQNGDLLTLGQSELEFHWDQPAGEFDPDTTGGASVKTSVLHIKRLITVVVVDIRGFTQLTQQIDERKLSEVIGDWFRRAGAIIRQEGSRVDKYIGDAIMAVWLHSSSQESDKLSVATACPDVLQAFQALRSIFEMTQEINRIYPLPRPIEIGAGVNTGYAIVGQLGTGERQEFTVIGDTVNAAFRIESATRQLDADIAVSEDTHAALWSQVNKLPSQSFFKCADVMLKGYASAHRVYHCQFYDLQRFLSIEDTRY